MKPLTLERVDKVEGDFTTAGRELRARKSPNYYASCFHSQHMVEKYLKVFLQEEGPLTTLLLNKSDLTILQEQSRYIIPVDRAHQCYPRCRSAFSLNQTITLPNKVIMDI